MQPFCSRQARTISVHKEVTYGIIIYMKTPPPHLSLLPTDREKKRDCFTPSGFAMTDEKPLYPSYSYLAGVGLRSGLQSGLTGEGTFTEDLFKGAMNGLQQGITNVGLSYAAQE